ncbi:Tigger transposable element-derived protein 1 [Araneus ventricosus]|uniref:Tigger transposable element-derived protein 1 n=1 Tax=Araneus ventricosus TaxID=182803 RepID=A0A4Y2LN42_ARAVE|nr:Tigger transposable element-derived protein 1 [Araneus ventricosus]
MWRANPKAWVTRQFFVQWVNLVFGPSVKKYLQENNLPMQALLVLDNAPAHPLNLEEFKFIKFLYLPPNTTPILQPMDQQVISNFKKLYTKHLFRRCFEVTENTNLTLREYWKDHFNIVVCLRMIDQAWLSVTTRTLTYAWKKLWPESVAERTFEGFEPEVPVVEEIVSLEKFMGLVIDERDVNELVAEYSQELTTEELQELQSQQHSGVLREIDFEEEPEVEDTISTSEIKEILGMWERVSQFVEKKHPEKVATGRASELFNDTCLTHFCSILQGRKKQTSMDSFFLIRRKRQRPVKRKAVTKFKHTVAFKLCTQAVFRKEDILLALFLSQRRRFRGLTLIDPNGNFFNIALHIDSTPLVDSKGTNTLTSPVTSP